MDKNEILLIAAGGTIAAEPYGATPEYVTVKENGRVVNALVETAYEQCISSVMDFAVKDSKDITKDDIARMADIIAQAPENSVIITHGTDAMAQNARALKQEMLTRYPEVLAQKRIVFTGAMEPLSHGSRSDGWANLRNALVVATHNARTGVSIVMHGQVYDPERTLKDFAKKVFYETNTGQQR